MKALDMFECGMKGDILEVAIASLHLVLMQVLDKSKFF